MARRDRSSSRRGEPGPGRGGKPRAGGRKPQGGGGRAGGPPRAGERKPAQHEREPAAEAAGPPANLVYGRNAVREANRREGPVGSSHLREMLDVLGLATLLDETGDGPPPEAVELAGRRGAARDARDWAEADRLRDELRAIGWEVRDGPQGPELLPAG